MRIYVLILLLLNDEDVMCTSLHSFSTFSNTQTNNSHSPHTAHRTHRMLKTRVNEVYRRQEKKCATRIKMTEKVREKKVLYSKYHTHTEHLAIFMSSFRLYVFHLFGVFRSLLFVSHFASTNQIYTQQKCVVQNHKNSTFTQQRERVVFFFLNSFLHSILLSSE